MVLTVLGVYLLGLILLLVYMYLENKFFKEGSYELGNALLFSLLSWTGILQILMITITLIIKNIFYEIKNSDFLRRKYEELNIKFKG